MIVLGFALIGFSIGSMLTHSSSFLSIPALSATGAVLLVVGLLLLVTELLERWLIKGQAALVDGLQAG